MFVIGKLRDSIAIKKSAKKEKKKKTREHESNE